MAEINIVRNEDWVEISVDGEYFHANHVIGHTSWVTLLKQLGHNVVEKDSDTVSVYPRCVHCGQDQTDMDRVGPSTWGRQVCCGKCRVKGY